MVHVRRVVPVFLDDLLEDVLHAQHQVVDAAPVLRPVELDWARARSSRGPRRMLFFFFEVPHTTGAILFVDFLHWTRPVTSTYQASSTGSVPPSR